VSSSVSIFGLGYVGSVSAACLASMGHRVVGVDVSAAKVEMIESGRTPIIEARMPELVAESRAACRLHATTDPNLAVRDSDISFVCVGTPSLRSGKLDLSHIEKVAGEILSLPMYPQLTSEQQARVVEEILGFGQVAIAAGQAA